MKISLNLIPFTLIPPNVGEIKIWGFKIIEMNERKSILYLPVIVFSELPFWAFGLPQYLSWA